MSIFNTDGGDALILGEKQAGIEKPGGHQVVLAENLNAWIHLNRFSFSPFSVHRNKVEKMKKKNDTHFYVRVYV